MKIFRECEKEFNILNGAGLYLGSLDKYREEEDRDVRDEREAKLLFEFEISTPTRVSVKWLNMIFGGAFIFGGEKGDIPFDFSNSARPISYSMAWDNLALHPHDYGNDYQVVSGSLQFKYDMSNCLVICMKKSGKNTRPISQKYNSRWFINGKQNIIKFKNAVASELSLLAKLRLSDEGASNKTIDVVEVKSYFKPIDYSSRETYIINSELDMTEELFTDLLTDVAFRKRPLFSPQNEVRFVFELYIDGKPPRLTNKSLVIARDIILPYVSAR